MRLEFAVVEPGDWPVACVGDEHSFPSLNDLMGHVFSPFCAEFLAISYHRLCLFASFRIGSAFQGDPVTLGFQSISGAVMWRG